MRQSLAFAALSLLCCGLISCSRDPNYLKQRYLESGTKYYDAGRFKEASIMFRKSIEADRKFGPAYYHLALTNLKQNQLAAAVPALRRAHELLQPGTADADDTDLKLSEIMIVASQNQQNADAILKEVQEMVAGLTKRNPNSWQANKLTGDLSMLEAARLYHANQPVDAKKTIGDAIVEYRKALAAKKDDPVIILALGRTLVLGGEPGEAETLFKSLIAKDSKNLNGYYELYRVYVSQRKLAEAEAILRSSIQNNPKDSQLRLTLAQFLFATNKRDDLTKLLNELKADLKQFPDAYLQSGDFYMRVNDSDQAMKEYETGIQKDPSRKTLYLKREIEAYIRTGKMEVAYQKNEQILKEDPKDPDSRGLKATFLLEKGDIDLAFSELQSVVTAKPNNFVNRFNLGRAHYARGEYEQARQEFDAAIELRPDYLPARLAQTQVALLRGDYEAGLRGAEEILKIAPNSVQGNVMKAASLQRMGKLSDARTLLEAILAKNPTQVETLLEMGVLDLNEKKNKDAIEAFSKAWTADHNNIRGLLGESRALLLDGQADKSVQIVDDAFKASPTRVDLQREVGNAQAAAGQYDKAIATYQAVMAKVLEPRGQADLWARIGEANLRKGDIGQAINSFEKSRQGDPQNPALTTELAMMYETQNKMDVARKYYETSIKIDPTNALALNNLAYLITEANGDLDLALTYANRAKQKLPNHPEVNDTLGWIYLKKNLTDNAVETFRTLVVQAPDSAVYHYHYAMALMQKGDRSTARKECQSALADKPNKQQADQIQQLIAKLG